MVLGDLVVEPARVPSIEHMTAIEGIDRRPIRPAFFVGRSQELMRLQAVMDGSARAVVIAVHGLGGVGKSTLVAHFAAAHADRFSLVWWVIADSASAITSGLADLAAAVAPQTAELTIDQRAELAVRWLATHDDWLLVLDNLTGPADATDLLNHVRTGTIIITSRQGNGWIGIESVQLEVLSPENAVQLLTQIIQADWADADLSGSAELCEELGWLPLAIQQAGAYISQLRITPAAYLDLLARFPAQMFAAITEGSDAHRAVARVWHVTLDRLIDTPLAGQLLRLLAWYAPDNIPRRFLTAGIEVTEPDLLAALRRLAAYSMVTLTSDTVSVHRLVQAVTRTPDPNDSHRSPGAISAAREGATNVLCFALDGLNYESPESWPVFEQVLPHAQALLNHTTPKDDSPITCQLAEVLSLYLTGQGDTKTSIKLLNRATQSLKRFARSGPSCHFEVAKRTRYGLLFGRKSKSSSQII
jgi:hypothetical protein